MKARNLTKEIKAKICAEYQDRSVKANDIRERYGVTSRQFKAIIEEAGIPPRSPNLWGIKKAPNGQTTKNVCPKCKRELANKEARFCWYCGSDVRSEKQILVERLEELTKLYDFIPAVDRDKYISTLRDTIEELKK